jgi:hypothetical protein
MTMNRICKSVAVAIAISATLVQAAIADEVTPQQALEKYAQSIALVKSYDVWLTGTETRLLNEFARKKDGKLTVRYEPVSIIRTFSARNVAENNENFRIETYDQSAVPQFMATVNGELAMSFEVASTSSPPNGLIQKRPDKLSPILLLGPDYGTFYANARDDVTFANAFSQRKTIQHVVDATKPEMYTIECPPDKDAAFLPSAGWRLTLDPLNGYLPSCLETYVVNMRTLSLRIEVLDYKTLPAGVAVPTKVKNTAFVTREGEEFGKPLGITEVTIDLAKSRWNCKLDPDTFELKFPPDTKVVDKTAK